MIVDTDKVSALIAEIADEEIFARFGTLSGEEINTKSHANDFVTTADQAAEAKLSRGLRALYPAAEFIGEEAAALDPALTYKLNDVGAFWIVDPLDGTRNFIQGRNEYATIVSLVVNGETRQGWIYAIPEKKFAVGSKGDGVQWNGADLTPVISCAPYSGYRAIGSLAEPWKSKLVPQLRSKFKTQLARCSAYIYLHLLRGDQDFALYSRCHPWDHAAGVLMLQEIGGAARYLDDGENYTPRATTGRPLLAAGDAAVWGIMSNRLSGG